MNQNAERLVAALIEENLEQVQKQLRVENAYCCLGVACEVYRRENPELAKWEGNHFSLQNSEGSSAAMPLEVSKYFGFADAGEINFGSFTIPVNNQYNNLSSLNDFAKYSLKEIGEFIKTEPEGLFKKE